MRTTRSPHRERGQVLPLTAILMVALLGVGALAIEVSGALATQRLYRSAGDGAALAGAQDLQQTTSRTVTGAERSRARQHAIDVLVERLGATATPGCGTGSDVVDCPLPGTPVLVSVRTPSPSCVDCDPERSMQVTVRNPSYGLALARIPPFNQGQWNVQSSSVAGLVFSGKYAIQTLRPPQPLPNGMDQNREDISVDGTNTRLNVVRGDIGTNTSAYTNSGGRITLGSGYRIDHIDDINPDPWNKDANGNPRGRLISRLLPDPSYPIASFSGAPTFANQAAGEIACPDLSDPDFPDDYRTTLDETTSGFDVTCYRPGIYSREFAVQRNTDVAYLLPGAYRLDGGLDVSGHLLGGLVRSRPGVVLVVPQSEELAGNNAVSMWLNLGDETCQADSCRALPAIDHAGASVQTPEGLAITIEVPRDEGCFTGTTPKNQGCSENQNSTIKLPGNGQLDLSGVIYAPSDNIQVNGDNTTQEGRVGQIVAWSIKYSGGAKLNQDYPGLEEVGILRLDAACTAPTEPCNAP